MSSTSTKLPSYLKHKRSGQAFVVLTDEAGKRRQVPLGEHGSPESKRRYREVLAKHLRGESPPGAGSTRADVIDVEITILELVARFLAWADREYRKSGQLTSEWAACKSAFDPLLALYGDLRLSEFSPKKLATVRDVMVEKGWARKSVNRQAQRVRRLFRWAVQEELCTSQIYNDLATVEGLRRGRTKARETNGVEPVAWADVEAVLPRVSDEVGTMILLAWHTGMRPQEVCAIRAGDIDRSGSVWVYRPSQHKTMHAGREREVYLGPIAQGILRPWLESEPESYLFSPARAEVRRNEAKRHVRETPRWASHERAHALRAANRETGRRVGDRYTTDSLRRAVERACKSVGVERWTPNRLRHSFATRVRAEHGLEAAQVTLGHAEANVTQIYAERDRALAIEVATRSG